MADSILLPFHVAILCRCSGNFLTDWPAIHLAIRQVGNGFKGLGSAPIFTDQSNHDWRFGDHFFWCVSRESLSIFSSGHSEWLAGMDHRNIIKNRICESISQLVQNKIFTKGV